MTKPLLEVRNLVKHFPVRGGGFSFMRQQLKAVDDVSFTLLETDPIFPLLGVLLALVEVGMVGGISVLRVVVSFLDDLLSFGGGLADERLPPCC